MEKKVICAYLSECYLAEELNCFGFKSDCPLYQRSNGDVSGGPRFDAAMDKLIRKTKEKHDDPARNHGPAPQK
ncbi:MAG: hypothetical protein DRP45_09245 [Candidatus Zixiibacteriota bacterium]|nr:MAG: hypothetical protein DRP45_09245 [candidate division Zixibacteria bacterium]